MRRFRPRRGRKIRVRGLTTEPAAISAASHPQGPGRLFVADVAVAATDSGWLCLAAVLDCYSRYCAGWATDKGLRPELVERAAREAVPAVRAGEITLALSPRCAATGIEVHPEATPGAMDGAVANSFFKLLRVDLAGSPAWRSRGTAAEAIATWITQTYNPHRVGPT
jgi:transposase InsO family protein